MACGAGAKGSAWTVKATLNEQSRSGTDRLTFWYDGDGRVEAELVPASIARVAEHRLVLRRLADWVSLWLIRRAPTKTLSTHAVRITVALEVADLASLA